MSKKFTDTQKNSTNMSNGTVFINGEPNIQNQLLSSFISQNTGFDTHCQYGIKVDKFDDNDADQSTDPLVVLFDCANKQPQLIWQEIGLNPEFGEHEVRLILFNVDSKHNSDLENEAIRRGVRGIFFKDSSIESFFKGIHLVIKGELWYSRKSLSAYLQNNITKNQAQYIHQTMLTRREKEILKWLVHGLSNAEIAEKLYLSIHTVKTHIYNLYKKIEVPSRLQAVLWADKNMPFDPQVEE